MIFVSRDRCASPYSRMVVPVPGVTVLEWFQREWRNVDAEDTIGGGAYGLYTLFEAVQEHDLPCPATLEELHATLDEHLWIEADDPLRLDERGLRVRTDDDEVDLAYYFLEDSAVARWPSRLAYVVNETWPLPADAATHGLIPDVPVRVAGTPAPGDDAVFLVRTGWEHTESGHNLDLEGAIVFPGVLLPELPGHLLAAGDGVARTWPADAQLLRSLVVPGDADPGAALRRYISLRAGYGLRGPDGRSAPTREQVIAWAAEGPADASRADVSTHIGQAARYLDSFFGYDQMLVFDTRWAAAHPGLAESLLRYAAHWDPFE
ncbi:hypothetical protein AB0G04_10595 [Actinoplanes sp. NPDC023801]|uniref:hypothetical protein n=1 Tax=Actinoplanes sp. NPDC023801 TaxID=3154595 RepID=UPI0033E63912